jgi:dsDNA-binding SOS-regulon protein
MVHKNIPKKFRLYRLEYWSPASGYDKETFTSKKTALRYKKKILKSAGVVRLR